MADLVPLLKAEHLTMRFGGVVANDDISFTLDEMELAYDRRWPFGTPATILVDHPGGFPAGEHELTLLQQLRVSYLPFPSINTDRKTVSI